MSRKDRKGFILSELEFSLLITLKNEELYGLELLERINKARRNPKVKMSELGIGSLYPTLKRMEEAKLIKGEFREPVAGEGSPRRKYYKLLEKGLIAIRRTQVYRTLLEDKQDKTPVPNGTPA